MPDEFKQSSEELAKQARYAKVNPTSPVFWLKIGDNEITLTNSPTQSEYVVSFSMTRSSDQASSDIRITLYDDTALLVEFEVIKGRHSLQFRYGQDITNMSETFQCMITSYDPEFVGTGYQVTLECTIGIWGESTGTESEESKTYEGSPTDMFKQVAKEEGWTLGNVANSKKTDTSKLNRTSETAEDFIKNKLIPIAVGENGEAPFYYTREVKDGKTVVNFAPATDATTQVNDENTLFYEMVVGQDHESIIEFRPSFRGIMRQMFSDTNPEKTVDNGGGGAGGGTLDYHNGLWIGDSRLVGMSSLVDSTIKVVAEGGKAAQYFLNNYSKIESMKSYNVKYVAVLLGVNDPGTNIESTKKLLQKLSQTFSGMPIYHCEPLPVGKKFSYGRIDAATMNGNIKSFNSKISSFCPSVSNCSWKSGTGKGLLTSDGYLDDSKASDSVHLTKAGYQTYYNNIIGLVGHVVAGNKSASSGSSSEWVKEVHRITNQQRARVGAKALTLNPKLCEIAAEKSRDQNVNKYFDHKSPKYGQIWDMLERYGMDYSTCGENIAIGQTSPAEVCQGWWDSPGHHANIVNKEFTQLGVGYCKVTNTVVDPLNGNKFTSGYIWTQVFYTPATRTSEASITVASTYDLSKNLSGNGCAVQHSYTSIENFTLERSNPKSPYNMSVYSNANPNKFTVSDVTTKDYTGGVFYVWAKRQCNIFKGTSRQTQKLALVKKGTKLVCVGQTPAWYLVEMAGVKGYVMKESCSTTKVDSKDTGVILLDENGNQTDLNGYTSAGSNATGDNAADMGVVSGAAGDTGTGRKPAISADFGNLDSYTNVLFKPTIDPTQPKRRIGSSSYSGSDMWKIAEKMFREASQLCLTAELELRGDASIKPQTFVSLVVLTKDGYFHHTSGLYQVLEVSDTIEGGTYTTTLNMFKRPVTVNDDGSISLASEGYWAEPPGSGTGFASGGSGGAGGVAGQWDEANIRAICDKYNGCSYSQAARTGPNSYDCSSLVNAVMGDLGVEVSWATTADGWSKRDSWGTKIFEHGSGTITADQIKPGMVGLYNGHTWLFVSGQQIFHAAGVKKGVLYANADYYLKLLNNQKGCVLVPPASTGTPLENNGIKSRRNM